MQIIDAHCHLHAYEESELGEFMGIRITAVSENYESSLKTIRLGGAIKGVDPFIGIHPWEIRVNHDQEILRIRELVDRDRVMGIGEVGLDKRFSKAPIAEQMMIYREFCLLASESNLPMNVHALGAWQEALSIAARIGVRAVLLHWYNGPLELLKEIMDMGYFISINPAVLIQERHRRVMEAADLSILLTESDGPYNYRGIELRPSMVIETLRKISEGKKLDIEETASIIARNYERYLRG